jgi:lysophospholipase
LRATRIAYSRFTIKTEALKKHVSLDETPIFYRRVSAVGPVKAKAMLVHGMGEHGGRYLHLASYLSNLGVECVVPDLRGFGLSGGKRACIRQFSDFHQDMRALHAHCAKENTTPFFLIGHSFGGLIVSSYVAESSLKPSGLILSSPIFGIAIPVPAWRHALGLTASYLFPDYKESSRVNPDKLTHDESIKAVYAQDKLIYHRISARLYRELTRMIQKSPEIAATINVPSLVLQAGDDFVVSKKAALDFFGHLASKDKELEVYDGFFHEIFNETGRQQVFARLGRWISDRV